LVQITVPDASFFEIGHRLDREKRLMRWITINDLEEKCGTSIKIWQTEATTRKSFEMASAMLGKCLITGKQ